MHRLLSFLETNQAECRALGARVASIHRALRQDQFTANKLVDDLLADSKKLLMLPVSSISIIFPKIVRDLCRDQGKEADLVIEGGDFEIDKRVLEEMKDPLIHVLRNCVAHGIETPEQRRRHGKSARARIQLSVSPVNGNKVEIRVSDDGAGVNLARVKESAVAHGAIGAHEAARLNESEILELVFRSDVSTSPMITQISGRGLGMAIVRQSAEKLGGKVAIESQPNAGATVRILLPVALATFRGLILDAAGQLFIVPTAQVSRVARFRPADVKTVENRETLSLNGAAVALARLGDILGLAPLPVPDEAPSSSPAIVVGEGDQRVAFAVNEVLDEQEVLVKRFTKPLVRVRDVAGAAVLGSGRVALILNLADLLKSARGVSRAPVAEAAKKSVAADSKAILLAEDSITSRMLLKGILESAGFRVQTAVDGLDALSSLRAQPFDLVVSDVEMPRLNGFELTARIRADKKLAEIPVILVTALETPTDRERGLDAGANAYLVKRSFDQSNLLDAVRRLV
jgi:two-component system chemotaxis sensor kinase CheA